MRTSDFNFDLPPELIAQEPLPERTQSRMMVVHRAEGRIEHRTILDLPDYLDSGDLLVLNDTRVLHARLLGHRVDTGGKVEILLLEERGEGAWEALYRASRKPRPGLSLSFGDGRVTAEIMELLGAGRVLVAMASEGALGDAVEQVGVPPLPPYIKRSGAGDDRTNRDRTRYQTVYADRLGAIAAPTAGLHFTDALLDRLRQRGVDHVTVTLHVGIGTFRPVKTERVADHVMDAERYELNDAAARAIRRTREQGRRVVAVGSTSVRTLETVASRHPEISADSGRSQLFIYPPYRFEVVGGLLTNFHLPQSTLIMMVSAFAEAPWATADTAKRPFNTGRELVLHAYRQAVAEKYRFYSYGDCMLML